MSIRTAGLNDAFFLLGVTEAARRIHGDPQSITAEVGKFLAKPAASNHLRNNGDQILSHLKTVVGDNPPDYVLKVISDVAELAGQVSPSFSAEMKAVVPL
jgi:hypothetical protein